MWEAGEWGEANDAIGDVSDVSDGTSPDIWYTIGLE